jgi:hypothetical protein
MRSPPFMARPNRASGAAPRQLPALAPFIIIIAATGSIITFYDELGHFSLQSKDLISHIYYLHYALVLPELLGPLVIGTAWLIKRGAAANRVIYDTNAPQASGSGAALASERPATGDFHSRPSVRALAR